MEIYFAIFAIFAPCYVIKIMNFQKTNLVEYYLMNMWLAEQLHKSRITINQRIQKIPKSLLRQVIEKEKK